MAGEIKTNEDLGYDVFFEVERESISSDKLVPARVVVEYRGLYKVKNVTGEYLASVTGKQMFKATDRQDFPAVGDWVLITELDSDRAVINGILPRKTIIKRKASHKNESQIIATNVDVAFVVESIDRDYSLNRFERYFAIAYDGGVQPVIVLNKIDLISETELDQRLDELKKRFKGVDIILASTVTEDGLDQLKKYIIKGQTYCFLGSSGVGKSSLINKLLGQEMIKTENISVGNERGKHTTTKREMYFLPTGGIVIDNPGMREVGLTDAGGGVDNFFEQISELALGCKFGDCTHTTEPGCKILAALQSGELDEEQYNNYTSLKKETEFYEMTEVEKREKDRQFGKFIKKVKKDLSDYGHKNFG